MYDGCWYALMCTYVCAIWNEMRWDPLGSHDQGNQSRNGFVHQTVVLKEKAVLAEKSAR